MRGDEFVSLADLLRVPADDSTVDVPANDPTEIERSVPEIGAAIRDAKLFRARLADALAAATSRLLRELAAAVLARELRIAPCDLAALLRDVLERAPVVRVRAAPADAALALDVPVVTDAALDAGDAIVELDGGALDARLGVRLAQVLEAFA